MAYCINKYHSFSSFLSRKVKCQNSPVSRQHQEKSISIKSVSFADGEDWSLNAKNYINVPFHIKCPMLWCQRLGGELQGYLKCQMYPTVEKGSARGEDEESTTPPGLHHTQPARCCRAAHTLDSHTCTRVDARTPHSHWQTFRTTCSHSRSPQHFLGAEPPWSIPRMALCRWAQLRQQAVSPPTLNTSSPFVRKQVN